jgi:hypothetical protein
MFITYATPLAGICGYSGRSSTNITVTTLVAFPLGSLEIGVS